MAAYLLAHPVAATLLVVAAPAWLLLGLVLILAGALLWADLVRPSGK